ncbi:MAG: response regulator transcription factor [Actinomycetota bacterium]|nr:response regulator transcription factor [Actinomycetota bacterium]
MAIRIVIAEDNALLREGLVQLVDRTPDFDLVGSAADLPGVFALLAEHEVDVVVTDIRMPPTGTDEGIQVASWLRTERPEVGVVVLSMYAEPDYALALLADGSKGRAYLLKERVAEVDDLMDAIRVVTEGGSRVDSLVVDALVTANPRRRGPTLQERLTAREIDVLTGMAQGKNNAAIAASLCLSERAIEKHSNAIFSKLGLAEERDINRRVKAVLLHLGQGMDG